MTVLGGIDLHTHSTASDGTLRPAEVVDAAVQAGLAVVALTDHDTVSGWPEARAACPASLTLELGVEMSCHWNGVQPPISLHLLGYRFDPEEPALAGALAASRKERTTRARRMIDLLNADGIDVSWDEVSADAAGGAVGRPHLARALMRRGLVASVSEGFGDQWLGERYRIRKRDLDVLEALRLIRGAGGAAVFAHPLARRRGRVVPDEVIERLAREGLAGLEVDHEDHTPAEREHLRELAEKLGLFATGSSDFHGTNKSIPIGANTTAPEVYTALMATGGREPSGP